jgi:hypothetical protein
MSVSAVAPALTGITAAQGLFGATARAASGVSAPAGGSSGGSAPQAVQVAVLRKALQMERSLLDVFA